MAIRGCVFGPDAHCNMRSMAVGEYISVSSQRDSEQADIEKERVEQAKGAYLVANRALATSHPHVVSMPAFSRRGLS